MELLLKRVIGVSRIVSHPLKAADVQSRRFCDNTITREKWENLISCLQDDGRCGTPVRWCHIYGSIQPLTLQSGLFVLYIPSLREYSLSLIEDVEYVH